MTSTASITKILAALWRKLDIFELQPAPPGRPPWPLINLITGYAAFVLALVVFDVLDMPRDLGSSEIAWSLGEAYKHNRFLSLETWLSFPPPLLQFVHDCLKQLIDLTGADFTLVQAVLALNLVTTCSGALFAYFIAARFLSPAFASLAAALTLAAQTPMHSSLLGGSTALAIFFALASLYGALRSAESSRPLFVAALAGACLSLATMARAEAVFICLPVVWLLAAKGGMKPAALYFTFAIAYFFAQEYLSPLVIAGHEPYSEYAAHYRANAAGEFSLWTKSALVKVGFFSNYPLAFSVLAVPAAIACFMQKKCRFFPLLWLAATLPILAASYTGAIMTSRPYYLAIAGFMMAFPIAGASEQVWNVVKSKLDPKKSSAAFAALSLALGISIFASVIDFTAKLRNDSLYAAARETKQALVSAISPDHSFFSDHVFYWSSYFAEHAADAGARDVYTYLRYCCVSEKAKSVLNPARFTQLTQDKSHVLATLDPASRQMARLLWGQGFIEKEHPAYFILLSDALYASWAAKPLNTSETASYVRPYIVASAEGKRLHLVELKYADARFCLREVERSEHFTLFRATYASPSHPLTAIADCPRG